MDNPDKIIRPTVLPNAGLTIKVPDTAEGRQFLKDLKRLLKVEELPFQKVCSSGQGKTHLQAHSASPSDASGSTTYGLDLRLEQEGWAP